MLSTQQYPVSLFHAQILIEHGRYWSRYETRGREWPCMVLGWLTGKPCSTLVFTPRTLVMQYQASVVL